MGKNRVLPERERRRKNMKQEAGIRRVHSSVKTEKVKKGKNRRPSGMR